MLVRSTVSDKLKIVHNGNKMSAVIVLLKWFAVLMVLMFLLYLSYSVFLWIQFSTNRAKWLAGEPNNYTVNVKYSSENVGAYAESPEIVQKGKVIQGRDEFGKADQPIIDWAFQHAQTCIPLWIL